MKETKLLIYDRIPCWYELSWRESPPTLIVRIHEDFIRTFQNIPTASPVVDFLKKQFGFKIFESDFSKNFGFEDGLKNAGTVNGFREFHIILPKIRVETDKVCRQCDGTGKREDFPDEECFYCDGAGKEHELHWHETTTISASLNVLFMTLCCSEIETFCALPQLMTIRLITELGPHGGSIGGTYGIEMCDWLRVKNDNVPEMEQAMMVAYDHMLTLRHESRRSFRTDLHNGGGWLNVTIPGDACGLNPSHDRMDMRLGYDFSCHNTDTPAQQLTLLAGLAALHDLVRKDMAATKTT